MLKYWATSLATDRWLREEPLAFNERLFQRAEEQFEICTGIYQKVKVFKTKDLILFCFIQFVIAGLISWTHLLWKFPGQHDLSHNVWFFGESAGCLLRGQSEFGVVYSFLLLTLSSLIYIKQTHGHGRKKQSSTGQFKMENNSSLPFFPETSSSFFGKKRYKRFQLSIFITLFV